MNWAKVRKVTTWTGILLGLVSDFLNLYGQFVLRTSNPPGIPKVFEDIQVARLSGCAFEDIKEEEGEAAPFTNIFDWVTGIERAERSAYANAEYKIWKDSASEGESLVRVRQTWRGHSPEEMAIIHRELVDKKGFQYIHKKFVFDEDGYRAKVIMGRPRSTLSPTYHSGCAEDSDQGRTDYKTSAISFSCDDLEKRIAENEARIRSSDTSSRCWLSYYYQVDFNAMKVKFEEKYFSRREGYEEYGEEEIADEDWWNN